MKIKNIRNNLSFLYTDFTSGIKNLTHWFKIIWKDRNYDYSYIYPLLEKKLELMQKYFETSDITDTRNTIKKIKICRILLQRLDKDDYFNINIYKDLKDGYFLNENMYYEELHKLVTNEDYMREQDLKYFCKIFTKHHLTWWD